MPNISLALYLGIVYYTYTTLEEFCRLPNINLRGKSLIGKPNESSKIEGFGQPKQIHSVFYHCHNIFSSKYGIITRDPHTILNQFYYERFLNRVRNQLSEFVIVESKHSGCYYVKFKEICFRHNEFVLIWSDDTFLSPTSDIKITPRYSTEQEAICRAIELVNANFNTVKDFNSFTAYVDNRRR